MSKRPLDLEGAVTTPSKKATVRRAQTANKRSVDEVHEESLTSKKRTKAVGDEDDEIAPSTTRKVKSSVTEEQKTAKKASTRRNTERLSSLLEAKNIIPSPVANKTARSFADEENGSDEEGEDRPVSAKKPRSRKSLQPKTPEPRRIEAVVEETVVVEKPPVIESVPVQRTESAPEGESRNYNSASLKVPSTQELRDNDATGELAGFWTQCREALSFCCATLYPSFLTVIVLAYLLHFVTSQREKDKADSVFVNLLVRIGLLIVCFGTLFAVQFLA
eukprot:gene11705-8341_t